MAVFRERTVIHLWLQGILSKVYEVRQKPNDIDNQIIKADPKCDFSGLVSGTEGYLQA